MIVTRWPGWFRSRYGGSWPRAYWCIDVEATDALIWEWGHCLVQDGVVADRMLLHWDWSDHPEWRERFARGNGLSWHETAAAPEAAAVVAEWLQIAAERRIPLVFHCGVRFDLPVLERTLQRFGRAFPVLADCCFDTGALEKASQNVAEKAFQPTRTDTLLSYFQRILDTPVKGVFYTLERCVVKYASDMKAAGIAAKDLHRADVDARACAVLMEAWRRCVEFDAARLSRDEPGVPSVACPPRVRSQRR